MQLCVVKTEQGLIPPSEIDIEEFEKLVNGQMYAIEITKPRNLKFHRKFFAMLKVGFDAWEPPPPDIKYTRFLRDRAPEKDFDRFRDEVLIECGFYRVAASIRSGEVRAVAESISFAKMDDIKFAEVYNKVATFLLQEVLTNYTEADLEQVTQRLLGFL